MKLADFNSGIQRRILSANPGVSGKAIPAIGAIPKDRYRSQLERDYAAYLSADPTVCRRAQAQARVGSVDRCGQCCIDILRIRRKLLRKRTGREIGCSGYSILKIPK